MNDGSCVVFWCMGGSETVVQLIKDASHEGFILR
jgi:hypothetical protein